MLCMVEEKLLDIKTVSFRAILINLNWIVQGEEEILGFYTDTKIILRFETVAYVTFPGKNITKTGMQDVERAQVISAVDTKKKACSNERPTNEIQSEPEKSLEEITIKEVAIIANK